MTSETVNRPSFRQCDHPDPKSRVRTAWRVWLGRFCLGIVYQNHPKGKWYVTNVSGTKEPGTFDTPNAASQRLQGIFEVNKPRKSEDEGKSPFLRYPQNESPPIGGLTTPPRKKRR